MQNIAKLFTAVLVCLAVSFAQTGATIKPADTTPSIQAQSTMKSISTGTLKKTPTNWTKIKDLFL